MSEEDKKVKEIDRKYTIPIVVCIFTSIITTLVMHSLL